MAVVFRLPSPVAILSVQSVTSSRSPASIAALGGAIRLVPDGALGGMTPCHVLIKPVRSDWACKALLLAHRLATRMKTDEALHPIAMRTFGVQTIMLEHIPLAGNDKPPSLEGVRS